MPRVAVLDHLAALSDPVRCRMLLLLEQRELTVSELCAVLQLPQSTVSRHLKSLLDDGWLSSRRNGTSHYYAFAGDGLDHAAPELWRLVREELEGKPAALQDARRLAAVLARRRTRSEEFFASAAGRWDQLREELFGSRFLPSTLLGLLDERMVIGDLGCGTGQVSAALAPFVRRVVGVDGSREMLRAARARLRSFENVELRPGRLERLPLPDEHLHAAVLMLVLHHVAEPVAVLSETARVLRPGGRLLVVDMTPHDREEYRQQMGHVWLGFSEKAVERFLAAAGLELLSVLPVPPEEAARGPALFTAIARKRSTAHSLSSKERS